MSPPDMTPPHPTTTTAGPAAPPTFAAVAPGWGPIVIAWLIIVAIPGFLVARLADELLRRDAATRESEVRGTLLSEIEGFERAFEISNHFEAVMIELGARLEPELRRQAETVAPGGRLASRSLAIVADRIAAGVGARPLMVGWLDLPRNVLGTHIEPDIASLTPVEIASCERLLEIWGEVARNDAGAAPAACSVAGNPESALRELAEPWLGPAHTCDGIRFSAEVGYSPRLNGRLMHYYSSYLSPPTDRNHDPGGTAWFAMFAESDLDFDVVVRRAVRRSENPGCHRELTFGPAATRPFFHQTAATVSLHQPLGGRAVTTWGFSTRNTATSERIREGLRTRGTLPLLAVNHDLRERAHPLTTWQPWFDRLALAHAVAILGLIALWCRFAPGSTRSLQFRLPAAILLGLVLPLAGLVLISAASQRLQRQLDHHQLRRYVQRSLSALERSVQHAEAVTNLRIGRFLERLAHAYAHGWQHFTAVVEARLTGGRLGLACERVPPGYLLIDNLLVLSDQGHSECLMNGGDDRRENQRSLLAAIVDGGFAPEFIRVLEHQSTPPSERLRMLETRSLAMGSILEGFVDPLDVAWLLCRPSQLTTMPIANAFDRLCLLLVPDPAQPRIKRVLAMASLVVTLVFHHFTDWIERNPRQMIVERLGHRIRFGIYQRNNVRDRAASERAFPATLKANAELVKVANRALVRRSEAGHDRLDDPTAPVLLWARCFSRSPFIGVAWAAPVAAHPASSGATPAMAAFSLLLGVVVALAFAAHLTGPILVFLAAADRTRRGDLDWELAVAGEDELSAMADTFNRMVQGLRERERISHFVSSEVMAAVGGREDEVAPGGERTDLTVLFAGIRQFSGLLGQLPPGQVVDLLIRHFTALEREVVAAGGVIDKFIGDVLMARFRARPGDDPAAVRAARAATAMLMAGADNPDVRPLGIGIASGVVIAGRIGSPHGRLDHTVIGNPVNLASRLEGIALRQPDPTIALDEETAARVAGCCRVELLDHLPIKGRTGRLPVHRIVLPASDREPGDELHPHPTGR